MIDDLFISESRILIMTVNHLEKLDSIFIYYKRINQIIEFSLINRE